jgi:hypothetical protein
MSRRWRIGRFGTWRGTRGLSSRLHSSRRALRCVRRRGSTFLRFFRILALEGHRALYWVIISRPPPDQYETAVYDPQAFRATLFPEAVDEIRLACLQVGDQTLFSHLWKHPAYGALSGTDELLLGAASPTDYVEVQETTAARSARSLLASRSPSSISA